MKKQIAMFLVAVSLLMLVSCSTLNPSESVAETTIGTDITPTDTFKAYASTLFNIHIIALFKLISNMHKIF